MGRSVCSRVSILTVVSVLLVVFATIIPSAYCYNEKEFARLLVTRKCIRCDLYNANFCGADLTGVDLSYSNLIRVNFQKATLYKAILREATITGANFTGAMWINGEICQPGSYGRCVLKKKE